VVGDDKKEAVKWRRREEYKGESWWRRVEHQQRSKSRSHEEGQRREA